MEIFFCVLLIICILACWYCERRIKAYQQEMTRLRERQQKQVVEMKQLADELARTLRMANPLYHYHEN
ncbi:hypothetical protein GCM10028806_16110 [Spirosoma terrae]